MTKTSRRWGSVAAVAVLGTCVAAGTVPASAAGPALPPLNRAALRQSIAGLPDDQTTAAVLRVSGRAGNWRGTSGVANVTTGGRVRADDRFRIGSISKVFVATVVLQLVAEHRLGLDRPIQSYLPGLLRKSDPPVTVRELLNHTSGLGPATGIATNTGDATWFTEHRLDTFTTDQILGSVLRQPLMWSPGTHQQYKGVNYIMLGMLIDKITGHGYAQEIQRRILDPLRLRDTSVPMTDPALPLPRSEGYYRLGPDAPLVDISEQNPSLYGAQGSMISTTADLDHFITALFGGRLLPAAELRDMFTIPSVATGSIRYGMGLLAYTFPDQVTVWGHTGETPGYASVMLATPDLARKAVYAFDPIGPTTGDQVLGTVTRIASAAFDPAG
jgi:D-alanyl-D-alanine carboxypeptidase